MPPFNLRDTLDGKGAYGGKFVNFVVCLVFISTLSFMLSTDVDMNAEYSSIFTLIEGVCTVIFAIEYVLRLVVAENMCFYILQPIALVDLASILPTILDQLFPGDNFPAMQFLRMLRLFHFLATSPSGANAANAFGESWQKQKAVLGAAAFAGAAIWVVTAALYYLTEKDNEEMLWCYPDPEVGENKHCVCDHEDGCSGSACICEPRFKSIPASAFFVILNLSGEFPLADKHSDYGRIVAGATAILSVAFFGIPVGMIGSAIEDSVTAMNTGDDKDFDVDDEDKEEIIASVATEVDQSHMPDYVQSSWYYPVMGLLVSVNAVFVCMSSIDTFSEDRGWCFLFFAGAGALSVLFAVEQFHRLRLKPQGYLASTSWSLIIIDSLAWMPWVFAVVTAQASATQALPISLGLLLILAQICKFERWLQGFVILSQVIDRSLGVLAVGGMAALVLLVFCSTLMYYAERENPDPKMAAYYSSVPNAMWITLLNMSGEAPLCDYTFMGSIIVGFVSISAVAVFGVPVGAIGGAFEEIISEIGGVGGDNDDDDGEGDEGGEEMKVKASTEEKQNLANSKTGYGSIPTTGDGDGAKSSTTGETRIAYTDMTMLQRFVSVNPYFVNISLFATLFGVGLEVTSTCAFASEKNMASLIDSLELLVVMWFTVEYVIRFAANKFEYSLSWLGVVDFLATFPYYVTIGLLGAQAAGIADTYDGPLRGLRILRLVRLDQYAPSLSLVDDAFRLCWKGLSVSIFAAVAILWLFNALLFTVEVNDEAEGEDKRFRNVLSSLQYSSVLLTGDYPLVDFSVWGKLFCSMAIVVAVGVVAVPANLLSNAFSQILEEQAEEKRRSRNQAASLMQNLFRKNKVNAAKGQGVKDNKGARFYNVVQEAMKNSKQLKGLDQTTPPFAASLTQWKNTPSMTSTLYHYFIGILIILNILSVIFESIPEVRVFVGHANWQSFESFSVTVFTLEYILNVITAAYDAKWTFSRFNFVTSFQGGADFWAIVPYYLQVYILPIYAPGVEFDATIFRILRLSRVLELERFFTAFSLIDDVFEQAAPVLKATGVLALIVWIGGASLFYYTAPHEEISDDSVADEIFWGGESGASFVSIPDAMYYTSIFLAGEWCKIDFTPAGSVICVLMALVGVALFSVPTGAFCDGFQGMLTEQKGDKKEAA
jgi:hypothetical protein